MARRNTVESMVQAAAMVKITSEIMDSQEKAAEPPVAATEQDPAALFAKSNEVLVSFG